jgi:chloramphenicol 3-O phosphotransferase
MGVPGQIVILNGAPRSGKSSIVRVIQQTFDGPWMSLGVDVFCRNVTPPRYQPGIGLRPGGGRPDLEELVPAFYAAMYDSIAAHSRHGFGVVVDVDHHEAYSRPLGVLSDCARRLTGLPVLWVGVRCPVEVIWQRREESWGQRYEGADDDLRAAVERWQHEVHAHGPYDLEVDTSAMGPAECARLIAARLAEGPPGTAFW